MITIGLFDFTSFGIISMLGRRTVAPPFFVWFKNKHLDETEKGGEESPDSGNEGTERKLRRASASV